MNKIKLFGVEYRPNTASLDYTTFEIFKNAKEAWGFANSLDDGDVLYIFTADFDKDLVYKEKEDGKLNYDDRAGLYENHKIVECFVCKNKRSADPRESVHDYLNSLGFINIDTTQDGQDIYRQKDDEPKMDIVIEFIEHKDNL